MSCVFSANEIANETANVCNDLFVKVCLCKLKTVYKTIFVP